MSKRAFAVVIVLGLSGIVGCKDAKTTRSASAEGPVIGATVSTGKATAGVDSITTDNYANTRLEFYSYIPEQVLADRQRLHPVLLCIPGLSGRGESSVPQEFKDFAEREKFVIIAPSFVYDEANWNARTSYQFPEAWSGNALLQIIGKVKEKNGLSISKLHLYGFSAGAQFALRFALWKPELCVGCVAHGSGGTVIPQSRNNVKFFVSVGKGDTNRIEKIEQFYRAAKNLDIDVVYRQYEGGHILPTSQITDALAFFKNG